MPNLFKLNSAGLMLPTCACWLLASVSLFGQIPSTSHPGPAVTAPGPNGSTITTYKDGWTKTVEPDNSTGKLERKETIKDPNGKIHEIFRRDIKTGAYTYRFVIVDDPGGGKTTYTDIGRVKTKVVEKRNGDKKSYTWKRNPRTKVEEWIEDTDEISLSEDLPSDVATHAKRTLDQMINDAEQLRASALAELPGKEGAMGNPGSPGADWKFTQDSVEAWFTKPIAELRSRRAKVDADLLAVRSKKLPLDGFGGFYATTYRAIWDSAMALWSLHQVEACQGRVPLLTVLAVVTYRQYVSEVAEIAKKYGNNPWAAQAEIDRNAARWDALRHQTFIDIASGERLVVRDLQHARQRWVGELWTWTDAAKGHSKTKDDIHDWAAKMFQMAMSPFTTLSSCEWGGLVDTRYSQYEWAKSRPYPDVQTNPAYPGDITLGSVLEKPLEALRFGGGREAAVTDAPSPMPGPVITQDSESNKNHVKQLRESAKFWRDEAEKARKWAREATSPKTKEQWEREAKWYDSNARLREELADRAEGKR